MWISGFVSGLGFAVILFTITFLVTDTLAERRCRDENRTLP